MQESWLIEVGYKAGIPDPVGLGLAKECLHARIKGIQAIDVSQLYRLTGTLSPAEHTRIMTDLLTDPIIQEAHDAASREGGATTIDISFKAGVTDVVGDTVMKGIRDLGVGGVREVRTGTRYRFSGLKRAEIGRQVALAFLANPLIQDIEIHVD